MKVSDLYQLRIPKWMVATWFHPDVKPSSATRNLSRDIARFPQMLHKLEAVGYRTRQRTFTYAQAMVLHEHYCGEKEVVSATQLLWQVFGCKVAEEQ